MSQGDLRSRAAGLTVILQGGSFPNRLEGPGSGVEDFCWRRRFVPSGWYELPAALPSFKPVALSFEGV